MPSLLLSVLMAAITLLGSLFDTNSGTHTVTATPAVNDLIVIVTVASGSVATTACTDNNSSGTYDVVKTCVKASSADTMTIQIRKALITSASSTIFTCAPGTTTGGGIAVYKVTGITRLGLNAARQSASQSNQATSTTPTPVFGLAALTGNPVIGAVFNASNVATMTPRSSPAYTEDLDTGWNSPTSGVETMHVNSGETGTSIAWGGTSGSAFCSAVVEIDTSSLVVTSPSPAKQSLALTVKTPTIPTVYTTIRVNCGGPAYVDSGGSNWQDNSGTFGTDIFNVANAIDNTVEDTLYQSTRFGNPFTLTYNVPNGSYSVTLKFAEIFHSAPNLREFNVSINGVTVLTNYDIWSACGGFEFRAIDTTFGTVVSGGSIALVFTGVVDNAQINALLITPSTVTSVTPATATLTITGKAPLIQRGVIPDKATVALTAKTPTTIPAVTVCSPANVAIALTAKTPNVRVGVVPATAALTFTARLPIARYAVSPAKAALALTAKTPVVRLGVIPATATLAVTPQTPTLRRGFGPAPVSLALSAQSPKVRLGFIPNKATITSTTQAALIRFGVAPANTALSVAAQTPILRRGVLPVNVALAITAKTPTIGTFSTTTCSPANAALTVTAKLPVVQYGILPAKTTLATTVQTPMLRRGFAPSPVLLALATNTPAFRSGLLPAKTALAISALAPTTTAGATVSISPAKATLAVTAQPPILRYSLFPGKQTLTLTGIAPSLRVSLQLPATTALTITARTPNERLGVIPGVGASLSITGKAVSLILAIPVPKTTLAVTPKLPVVRSAVVPGAATLAITGTTSVLNLKVLPGTAALTIALKAPVKTLGVIPAQAALTMTTQAARLALRVFPAASTLTIIGRFPSVNGTTTTAVLPANAAIALTPRAPSLGGSIPVPKANALTVTGRAPILVLAIQPAQVSVGITGLAPTVRIVNRVFPARQAIALLPNAPLLRFSVHVGLAHLQTTGIVPVLRSSIHVGTGQLVITGNPPLAGTQTLFVQPMVAPPLRIDGRTPVLRMSILAGNGVLVLRTAAPSMGLLSVRDQLLSVMLVDIQADRSYTQSSELGSGGQVSSERILDFQIDASSTQISAVADGPLVSVGDYEVLA